MPTQPDELNKMLRARASERADQFEKVIESTILDKNFDLDEDGGFHVAFPNVTNFLRSDLEELQKRYSKWLIEPGPGILEFKPKPPGRRGTAKKAKDGETDAGGGSGGDVGKVDAASLADSLNDV